MKEIILRHRAARMLLGRRRNGQSVVETLITVAVIAVGAFAILGLLFGETGTMKQLFEQLVDTVLDITVDIF